MTNGGRDAQPISDELHESSRSRRGPCAGRAVPASQAVWLLSLLPATDEPLDQELVLGADARYWRSVAKLALELVARERFVPILEMRR